MQDENNWFAKWYHAIAAIDLSTAALPDEKAPDSKDTFLGELTPYMQQHWIFLGRMRRETEELLLDLDDVLSAHDTEKEKYGDTIPNEVLAQFNADLLKVVAKLHEPYFTYRTNKEIFEHTLRQEFPLPAGKMVHGIRNRSQVVCRDKNDRGDRENPFERLDALGLDRLHRTLEASVAVAQKNKKEREMETTPALQPQ